MVPWQSSSAHLAWILILRVIRRFRLSAKSACTARRCSRNMATDYEKWKRWALIDSSDDEGPSAASACVPPPATGASPLVAWSQDQNGTMSAAAPEPSGTPPEQFPPRGSANPDQEALGSLLRVSCLREALGRPPLLGTVSQLSREWAQSSQDVDSWASDRPDGPLHGSQRLGPADPIPDQHFRRLPAARRPLLAIRRDEEVVDITIAPGCPVAVVTPFIDFILPRAELQERWARAMESTVLPKLGPVLPWVRFAHQGLVSVAVPDVCRVKADTLWRWWGQNTFPADPRSIRHWQAAGCAFVGNTLHILCGNGAPKSAKGDQGGGGQANNSQGYISGALGDVKDRA